MFVVSRRVDARVVALGRADAIVDEFVVGNGGCFSD